MSKMKYQICDCCGKELPKNITYFKKYSHKTEDGLNFHTTCRELKSNWDMDTVVYICKQIVNNYGN